MANSSPIDNAPISHQLALTPIKNFMTRKVVCLTPSSTVRVAMQIMLNHKVSGLIVNDNSNKCLGVYSELDAMLQGSAGSLDVPIKYTKPPKTVLPTTPFRDVLLLIVKSKFKRLPIVDLQNNIVGIVSRRDLMRAIFSDSGNAEKK